MTGPFTDKNDEHQFRFHAELALMNNLRDAAKVAVESGWGDAQVVPEQVRWKMGARALPTWRDVLFVLDDK